MKIATLCSYGRQLCPKRTTSGKLLSSTLVVGGKVNILLQLQGSSVLICHEEKPLGGPFGTLDEKVNGIFLPIVTKGAGALIYKIIFPPMGI